MSTSLRKKLSKRQAKGGSGDEALSSSTSRASTPTRDPIPFDDLSSTPPPPSAEGGAGSTIRRVSPSQDFINRYKLRAPAAVAPQVSPAKIAVSHRNGKATVFSEQFDDNDNDSLRLPSLPNTAPVTPVHDKKDPITVHGAGFQILTSRVDKGASKRSHSAEVLANTFTETGEQLLGMETRPRTTRSQARREQRADSAAAGMETEMTTKESSGSGIDRPKIPRVLSFGKNDQLPRTPSPREKSSEPQADRSGTITTPANSPSRSLQVPAKVLILKHRSGGFQPDDYDLRPELGNDSPEPRATPKNEHPSPPRYRRSSKPSTKQDPENSTESKGLPIPINPPRHDPTRLVGYQWISAMGDTSRPDVPWGWTKKWTCCHCNAQTMVEQKTCARLNCMHPRCTGACKVVRGGH